MVPSTGRTVSIQEAYEAILNDQADISAVPELRVFLDLASLMFVSHDNQVLLLHLWLVSAGYQDKVPCRLVQQAVQANSDAGLTLSF